MSRGFYVYQVHLLMVDTDLISRIFHKGWISGCGKMFTLKTQLGCRFCWSNQSSFSFLKYDTVLCVWRNTPLHDFSSNKTSKTFLSSYFRIIEKSFSVRQLLKGLVAQLVKMSGRHLPLWENVHTISSKILHIRTLNIFLVLTMS